MISALSLIFVRIGSLTHSYFRLVGKTDDEENLEYESLVEVIAPGKTLTVDVEPKNAFVIRYVFLKKRKLISLFSNLCLFVFIFKGQVT